MATKNEKLPSAQELNAAHEALQQYIGRHQYIVQLGAVLPTLQSAARAVE